MEKYFWLMRMGSSDIKVDPEIVDFYATGIGNARRWIYSFIRCDRN